MGSRSRMESNTLTLVEAVDALTSIADTDFENEITPIQQQQMIERRKVKDATKDQVKSGISLQHPRETIDKMKTIFKTILLHLRQFYGRDYQETKDGPAIERIKSIMVLVGDAAKKLDKHAAVFHAAKTKSVSELKEYKHLQEFYLSRIARKIDDNTLSRWILALAKQAWTDKESIASIVKKPIEALHVFVDLESVKKDTEYELFFMRKQDGSRFFSPRLLRNIKLVCDFGGGFEGGKREMDPLEDVVFWRDRIFNAAAKGILKSLGNRLERFYRDAAKVKDQELVEDINKALMALMLSANDHNQLGQVPSKSCADYFADFQLFLRQALSKGDYQKLITYPPSAAQKLPNILLDMLHGLCTGLFVEVQLQRELSSIIHKLVSTASAERSPEHEKEASDTLWSRLAGDEAALGKLLRRHSNGPLTKVLDILQEGGKLSFDPIFHQKNLCYQHYALFRGNEGRILHTRLPTPTAQEYVDKASVIEEFKGFIRGCGEDQLIGKFLLINLQDRTSWREHTRCSALEELQQSEGMDSRLTVVTLPKDTEFYHQIAPYHADNHAHAFIKHFKEQLSDDSAGFYFPSHIRKALFPHFIDGVLTAIHRIFFSGKNILLREHRQDFIEIFYLFLQLKLLELVEPDAFSLACKDGIDIGSSASTQLCAFLKIINDEELTSYDRDCLNTMMHAPSILERERVILQDRFNRVIGALKTIESAKEHLGKDNFETVIKDAFGDFFKTSILQSKPVFSR